MTIGSNTDAYQTTETQYVVEDETLNGGLASVRVKATSPSRKTGLWTETCMLFLPPLIDFTVGFSL